MSLQDRYNKTYTENKVTFGGGKPEKIVSDILKFRSSGSVLELGAGEGRNSIFLSENGFEVVAQDFSRVGLSKIDQIAKERGLSIHTDCKDIRRENFDHNFDVFVCTYALHHLKKEEALNLIKLIQASTNPRGLNAITTFTENGDFYREDPATENFYPKEDSMEELYKGWEILEYEEMKVKAFAKKTDGSPIFNVAAKLLARKK